MVEYYFIDTEKQKQLKLILDSWIDSNTPFRHHCCVKGLGCDCIHFVACILNELGILNLTKKTIPNYPKDWHLHNTRELLEEGIIKNLNVEKVDLSNLMNGDLVCSHFGKAASHAGIYFDGYIYQALNGVGVCRINFNDKKFKERMRFAYRLLS